MLDFDSCTISLSNNERANIYVYDVTNKKRANKGFRTLART